MSSNFCFPTDISQRSLSSYSDARQPFSGNFEHVTVLIETGDLLKEKVDAIINSTDSKKSGSGIIVKCFSSIFGSVVIGSAKCQYFIA